MSCSDCLAKDAAARGACVARAERGCWRQDHKTRRPRPSPVDGESCNPPCACRTAPFHPSLRSTARFSQHLTYTRQFDAHLLHYLLLSPLHTVHPPLPLDTRIDRICAARCPDIPPSRSRRRTSLPLCSLHSWRPSMFALPALHRYRTSTSTGLRCSSSM